MQNGKIDPKMSKTDPDLKARNWLRLVCEIANVTWFFIGPGLFYTDILQEYLYFYSSSDEDILSTIR